jgi:hypothetical protein
MFAVTKLPKSERVWCNAKMCIFCSLGLASASRFKARDRASSKCQGVKSVISHHKCPGVLRRVPYRSQSYIIARAMKLTRIASKFRARELFCFGIGSPCPGVCGSLAGTISPRGAGAIFTVLRPHGFLFCGETGVHLFWKVC